jgi:hypothetical protein
VIPRLFTTDVIGLVNFLRVTFHARGELRDGVPTEVRIGDSLIMISDGGGLRGPVFSTSMLKVPIVCTREQLSPAPSQSKRPRTCLTVIGEPWCRTHGAIFGRSQPIEVHNRRCKPAHR